MKKLYPETVISTISSIETPSEEPRIVRVVSPIMKPSVGEIDLTSGTILLFL